MSDHAAKAMVGGPYKTIVADPPWPYNDAPLGFQRDHGRDFLPYGTMTLEQIRGLNIGDLAMPGAHLYLWTTNRFFEDAYSVVRAWGWTPLQVLTWCKEPMGVGPGAAFSNTTEFALFCRRPVGHMIQAAREAVDMGRAALHDRIFGTKPTGLIYRWEADDCYPSTEQWERLQELLPDLTRDPLTESPTKAATSWWVWKRGPHSAKPEAFLDVIEQVSPGPYLELFARRNRLGWDTWGNEALRHVEVAS